MSKGKRVIPWGARIAVMIGDAWQWIPFMFIVLLAGLESLSTEQKEAAIMDGAGGWEIFRDITWPTLLPVSATIVLIRLIEAFKIIDLPTPASVSVSFLICIKEYSLPSET